MLHRVLVIRVRSLFRVRQQPGANKKGKHETTVEHLNEKKREAALPARLGTNNFVASINDLAEAGTPEMVSVTELGYRMMRPGTHLVRVPRKTCCRSAVRLPVISFVCLFWGLFHLGGRLDL